jgi:hypothetical protein
MHSAMWAASAVRNDPASSGPASRIEPFDPPSRGLNGEVAAEHARHGHQHDITDLEPGLGTGAGDDTYTFHTHRGSQSSTMQVPGINTPSEFHRSL